MQNLLPRLKFLLTATNEHGVHSPFVFNYVTECLYARPEYCRKKSENILLKSIAYFGAKHLAIPAQLDELRDRVASRFPSVQFRDIPFNDLSGQVPFIQVPNKSIELESEPFDILFMHPFKAEKIMDSPYLESKIHNDTLLLVDGIHRDTSCLSQWENLKNHFRTTVTLDLFYCGAVFFRREQAEEHFKIRI